MATIPMMTGQAFLIIHEPRDGSWLYQVWDHEADLLAGTKPARTKLSTSMSPMLSAMLADHARWLTSNGVESR